MKLKEKIDLDFKNSMKEKNVIKKDTLSFVRAAIKQIEVDERRVLDCDEITALIAKQIKMRKDAISEFKKGNREDLIDSYQAEVDVLEEYMPKQLSDDEILAVIEDKFNSLDKEKNMSIMGLLMKEVMAEVSNTASGDRVSQLVKDFILK